MEKSVTDRSWKVKHTEASWEGKISDEGRGLLEFQRRLNELRAATGLSLGDFLDPANLEKLSSLTKQETEIRGDYSHLEGTRTVVLKPELFELLPQFHICFQPGENRVPAGLVDFLESVSETALFFESDPRMRGLAYFFGYVLLQVLKGYLDIGGRQIPPLPSNPSHEQCLHFAGKLLENIGKGMQGKGLLKGKTDFELIDTLKLIQKHETQKMTWKERRDALAFAGCHVSDADSLRVFAHRARRKGLL